MTGSLGEPLRLRKLPRVDFCGCVIGFLASPSSMSMGFDLSSTHLSLVSPSMASRPTFAVSLATSDVSTDMLYREASIISLVRSRIAAGL